MSKESDSNKNNFHHPVPIKYIYKTCLLTFPLQGLTEFKDLPEYVSEVSYAENDKRVAFVSTPAHGYYVLATTLDEESPIGLIIGEEDGGIGEEWQIRLGWENKFTPLQKDYDDAVKSLMARVEKADFKHRIIFK